MDKIIEKWDEILNTVKREYEISDVSFDTWIRPLEVFAIEGNTLYILVPSEQMALTYISKKYLAPLRVAIVEITEIEYDIEFILPEQAKNLKISNKPAKKAASVSGDDSNLNPNYTFDTFVVGNNNRFAHSASLAVAESPGEAYNPLYIYGGPGLGKTHLMHSIGHFILNQDPNAKVIYVTSEEFTNEVIESIRNGNASSMTKFRDKYRKVDVLMIDDIQFIIGKESTQEEFFHTFNALYEANKQIVLTSDRPPKEIHTLEDRLKTRFEWGLLADIQPPDYETRMAIIHVKADSLRVQLPEDVVDYIAKTITSNVRQLEGTVKKIKALHDLMERAIDIELAKEAVADIFKENPGLNPTPEMILREVSRYYCTPVEKLKGSGRSKDLVLPRQVAMYLVRDLTDYSLPEIGKIFSRDHTTVLHSINKIENYLKETSEMDNIIKTLKTNIRG